MAILPSRRRRPMTEQEQISVVAKALKGALPPGASPGTVVPVDTSKMMRLAANKLSQSVQMPPAEIEAALISEGMEAVVPFTPGRPLNPFHGYGMRPRTFNYSVGRNIAARPRQYRTNFDTIRNLIERYDIAQICIRHIIDDIRSMPLQFNPIEGMMDDVSDEIKAAKAFWAAPDGDHDWPEWLGLWLQDILRYDGGCLYKRRDMEGKLISLDVVDTTTIAPLIDFHGRRPGNGAPAYLQFVQGLPWDWLTKDDIVYTRFNPIPEDVYGVSPVEMVMLNANIDIRFQWFFLQYFTEGTVPDGFMEAPPDQSSVDQVAEWQETWEAWLAGDQGQKHKIRWVPAGSKYAQSKDTSFDKEFPLYLARRTIAAFGLVPSDLGFTEDVNRSTSDTQMDVQFRISTAPKTLALQHIMSRITQEELGLRVKVSFDDGREKEDRLMEAQAHQIYVSIGAESPDEVRRDILGYEVNPAEMIPRGIISPRLGFIPLRWAVGVSGEIDSATGAPMPGSVEEIEYVMPGTPGPSPLTGDVEVDVPLGEQATADINPNDPDPISEDLDSSDDTFVKELTDFYAPTIRATPEVDALEVGQILKQWRRHAKNQIAKGKAPRRFEDDGLPEEVADYVWLVLSKATTKEDVDRAFSPDRSY